MKVGVLSDTHLKAMSTDLEKLLLKKLGGSDIIFHAGDVVEMNVLDIFQSQEIYLVSGNMDSAEIKENNPYKRVIEVGGYRIGLIHGWGSPSGLEERIQGEFKDVDCIVFGHTHNPCNRKISKMLFFNPGSPTDRRFAKANSVGILKIKDGISGEILYL